MTLLLVVVLVVIVVACFVLPDPFCPNFIFLFNLFGAYFSLCTLRKKVKSTMVARRSC